MRTSKFIQDSHYCSSNQQKVLAYGSQGSKTNEKNNISCQKTVKA